jgi:hypothetical protein
VARLCGHKGAQTSIGPSQSPSRSWRRHAQWDVPPPWGEGFGIPNRSPDPLVRRAGRDHPFPISSGSPWRERDVARRVGHGCCHPREKNYGHRTPPGSCLPHGGTPEAPHPRGGTLSEQGPGIVVVVSCGVVAPVEPVPKCPSQGSSASLQCSCRSQSLVSDAGGSRRSYWNGRV